MSEKHERTPQASNDVTTLECDYCMQKEPSPPFVDGHECTMCYGRLRDQSVKTLEQQLAEVTAERDALKRRVANLENSHAAQVARAAAEAVAPHAYPELVRVLAGNGVDLARLAEALPGYVALKRRVEDGAEIVLDAVWRAISFADIEATGIDVPDPHLRPATPEDLCREIVEIGRLLGYRQGVDACPPKSGSVAPETPGS